VEKLAINDICQNLMLHIAFCPSTENGRQMRLFSTDLIFIAGVAIQINLNK
jgi:hypothetical protein